MSLKFGTHMLLFGQDKWAMKYIESAYPHFDRIYVAYSKLPWNYNPSARKTYVNAFDLNVIKNSKFIDKVTIIEGDWLTEEEQRNACYDKAKQDGIDYLMIRDADEFYHNADFIKMKEHIQANPNHEIYKSAWICFWKTLEYILVPNRNNIIVGYPEIFINLNKNINFKQKRTPIGNDIVTIPNILCYHAAYVLSNLELIVKLKTWGHASDFNVDNWYQNIWLKWYPEMTNLHPINPSAWFMAIKFNGELPEILTINDDNIQQIG